MLDSHPLHLNGLSKIKFGGSVMKCCFLLNPFCHSNRSSEFLIIEVCPGKKKESRIIYLIIPRAYVMISIKIKKEIMPLAQLSVDGGIKMLI